MNSKEEVLNEIITDCMSEKTPDLIRIKGDKELVSLFDVMLILKNQNPPEKEFQYSLEEKLFEKYFSKKKSFNLNFKMAFNCIAILLMIFGFSSSNYYVKESSSLISYKNDFSSYETYFIKNNLHYESFLYNNMGFIYLPVNMQNVLR